MGGQLFKWAARPFCCPHSETMRNLYLSPPFVGRITDLIGFTPWRIVSSVWITFHPLTGAPRR
jgi:hypothetical protein